MNPIHIAPLGLFLLVAGCINQDMPDADEGAKIYSENCAMCHGPDGRGNGENAAGLSPKPVDLTQETRRNGGSFPVNKVLSQIDGYTRDGVAGDGMPEFGTLLEGDLVPVETAPDTFTPTPRPLAALLAYLESIQR
ncbi:c-type cytochrome [Shimia litoralis]|nr:cytochrome c [Shimia litoralis]